jgi:hypothetical protein
MNFYNGYTPKERERKLRASYKIFPNRTHPYYRGPCQLCGDSGCPVEPHTEDYSEPYLWENPAEYAVCKTCHSRLHKRFKSRHAWTAYKVHLRRGGYGSDLKTDALRDEVALLTKALEAGNPAVLTQLPRDKALTGSEWWEGLSVDEGTLTDPASRPRP